MQPSEFPTDCEVCAPEGSSASTSPDEAAKPNDPAKSDDPAAKNNDASDQTSKGSQSASTAKSASASNSNGTTAADYQKYVGSFQGVDTECASLTKELSPGLGPTSSWKQGDLVQGNTNLQPGTPIATFNFDGKLRFGR
jgi:hypothetical protein